MRAFVVLSLVLIAYSRACAAASPDRGFYVEPSAGVLILSGGSSYVPEHDEPMIGIVGINPAVRTTCSKATDLQSLGFGYRYLRIWSVEADVVRVGSWSQRQQSEDAAAPTYHSDIVNRHSETGGSLKALATFALTKHWSAYLGGGYGFISDRVTTSGNAWMFAPSLQTSVQTDTLQQAEWMGGLDVKATGRVDLRFSVEQLYVKQLAAYPKPRMLALTLGVKIGL